MRKFTIGRMGLYACLGVVLFASCKNDSYLTAMPAVADQSFSEEFDTLSAALQRGWELHNGSSPVGPAVWQNGGDLIPWFAPYSNNGSNAGFVGAGYLSTSGGSTIIANWLISPAVTLQNGDSISFYTRAYVDDISGGGVTDSTDWANHMELLISTSGANAKPGDGNSYGDFGKILVDINPYYYDSNHNLLYRDNHTNPALFDPLAYPIRWTRFVGVVHDLAKPATGRFAFRYHLIGGGNAGYGSGVAIDKVEYKSASRNK
ncbi:choice-of-anchor J domain-containing protein [Flaviaesturariibacter terrae]